MKRFRSQISVHFHGDPRYFAERSQRVSPATTVWTIPSDEFADSAGACCANAPIGRRINMPTTANVPKFTDARFIVHTPFPRPKGVMFHPYRQKIRTYS